MPIYEYQCTDCGHRLETIQRFSDAPLTDCPQCAHVALKKLVSAPAFRLKGSGWYETDFKSGEKRNIAGGGDGGDSAASDKAGGDKSSGDKSSSDKSTSETSTNNSAASNSSTSNSSTSKGAAESAAPTKKDTSTASNRSSTNGGTTTATKGAPKTTGSD